MIFQIRGPLSRFTDSSQICAHEIEIATPVPMRFPRRPERLQGPLRAARGLEQAQHKPRAWRSRATGNLRRSRTAGFRFNVERTTAWSTRSLRRSAKTRHFAAFQAVAERKLQMLDSASTLDFLKSPPGNHLEALTGDRVGQHSIRIHAPWRICFVGT